MWLWSFPEQNCHPTQKISIFIKYIFKKYIFFVSVLVFSDECRLSNKDDLVDKQKMLLAC